MAEPVEPFIGDEVPKSTPPENEPPRAEPPSERTQPDWERSVLERLAFAALKEQRAARRWGIFFKLVLLAYLTYFILASLDLSWLGRAAEKHTALIDLQGIIDPKSQSNADQIMTALQNAFKDGGTEGVVIRVNSPGGSPVQAGIIHDEILRLRAKYPKIPVYAVVEDVCASGSYYVAAAADKIFVDRASLVGSIGVLIDGFGFTGAMEKLGIERRLLTAGANKGFLDPFSPLNDTQRAHAQEMIERIHQQFIDVVKKGRGARLKETPDLFSGLVWTGEESIKLGLADDYGTVDGVARDVIKADTIVDYTVKGNLAERLARRFGTSLGQALGTMLSGWRLQ